MARVLLIDVYQEFPMKKLTFLLVLFLASFSAIADHNPESDGAGDEEVARIH